MILKILNSALILDGRLITVQTMVSHKSSAGIIFNEPQFRTLVLMYQSDSTATTAGSWKDHHHTREWGCLPSRRLRWAGSVGRFTFSIKWQYNEVLFARTDQHTAWSRAGPCESDQGCAMFFSMCVFCWVHHFSIRGLWGIMKPLEKYYWEYQLVGILVQ